MISGPLLSLGASALQFLLLVSSQGPESGRLLRQTAERIVLLEEDSWQVNVDWGWATDGNTRRWFPSAQVTSSFGPVRWGLSGSIELTTVGADSPGMLSYLGHGWVLLPLKSFLAPGLPDPQKAETRRLTIQGVIDRNRILTGALAAFHRWACALEQAEVHREHGARLQELLDTGDSGPSDVDPILRLEWEAELLQAEFMTSLSMIQAVSAESLCRTLSGADTLPWPQLWEWSEAEPLKLPEIEGSSLQVEVLKLALTRDSEKDREEAIKTGPSLKFWSQGSGTGALTSGEKGWRESPTPWSDRNPFSTGLEIVLPLNSPGGDRSSELRRLILHSEVADDIRYSTEVLSALRIKEREWRLKSDQAARLALLVQKAGALRLAGEISSYDHEKSLNRYREALASLGACRRELNLAVLELLGRTENLSTWIEKEVSQ